MPFSPTSSDRLLSIYLTLSQYPILSSRIRARMRLELFQRGLIQPAEFEAQVRQTAIQSQHQEGLDDPFVEEALEIWEVRVIHVRDQLTDVIFSQHFEFSFFEELVNEVLGERGVSVDQMLLSLNPEMAPMDLVFEQGMTIERMPPEQRMQFEARLKESKVVLIRTLISDQLRYINIAKEWFTLADLAEIRRHKIGGGRIGGKAAGMLLAMRILLEKTPPELKGCLTTPESYYIGSDELYSFMQINNLFHWNDQKYKNEEDMRADYPQILQDFEEGEFAPDLLDKLNGMLERLGNQPVIVRSSSLLEDNFGTSFAGKYESIFLPNQASHEENFRALMRAIARVYASTLNPNALLYRRSRGLQDYDERMAILIQVVQGETFGRYYLPHFAGVAFSRNLYRWAPQIKREDGFVRLVWGMGTRAVDRVGNDYPRLIALSHPTLRPSSDPKNIRRYSQGYVDLIDLEDNQFKTLPIQEVLTTRYPALRYLAQEDTDGYFASLRTGFGSDISRMVLTFEELLKRTPFALQMKEYLNILEESYRSPVDMEFVGGLKGMETGKPSLCISILQCRPQSHLIDAEPVALPMNLKQEDIIFSTRFVVPEGCIMRADLVLFVPPEGYFALKDEQERHQLVRVIGKLNNLLEGKKFICVGPGRWGSSNSDLGVPIDYGDIYHTRALVELSGKDIGPEPEPSLGTHFFQDLLEAQIYPLAVPLEDEESIFNRAFFYEAPNRLEEFLPVEPHLLPSLRLLKVSDFRAQHFLRVVMSDEHTRAVAYLVNEETPKEKRAAKLLEEKQK